MARRGGESVILLEGSSALPPLSLPSSLFLLSFSLCFASHLCITFFSPSSPHYGLSFHAILCFVISASSLSLPTSFFFSLLFDCCLQCSKERKLENAQICVRAQIDVCKHRYPLFIPYSSGNLEGETRVKKMPIN
jgi:hypothetical protein